MKDDDYVEEKALELNNEILLEAHRGNYVDMAKAFIRTIVEDCQPKVSRDFVQKWRSSLGERSPARIYINPITLIALLKDAGVKVEDEHISVLPGIGAIKVEE